MIVLVFINIFIVIMSGVWLMAAVSGNAHKIILECWDIVAFLLQLCEYVRIQPLIVYQLTLNLELKMLYSINFATKLLRS